MIKMFYSFAANNRRRQALCIGVCRPTVRPSTPISHNALGLSLKRWLHIKFKKVFRKLLVFCFTMGTRRHGQGGNHLCPLWKYCKVFCALQHAQ